MTAATHIAPETAGADAGIISKSARMPLMCCRGRPDGLVVCHLPFGPTAYFGLHNCVTRHDIGSKAEVGTISEVHPNLVLENFTTPLGRRFATILKALFPVPKPTNKRIVTFANQSDFISMRCGPAMRNVAVVFVACVARLEKKKTTRKKQSGVHPSAGAFRARALTSNVSPCRHHTYTMPAGPKSLELTEVGPRMELQPYKIRLGTVADEHAEDEWVLRAYVRSAAKRQRLAEGPPDEDPT